MHWMLKFEQSCDYLRSEILEFQNKRIIPLIVTRGYVLSQKTKNEIQDVHNAYVINNRFVDELDRIAGKNGDFARTVLCQEPLQRRIIAYVVPSFNALMEEIDGRVYNFFANAKEIVDTYMCTGDCLRYWLRWPIKEWSGPKVKNIGQYLEDVSSFP